MSKFIEVKGNTVAEAIQKGLTELSVSIDEVDREVISQPKSGFFGFGASKAIVRLTLKESNAQPVEKTVPKEEKPKNAEKPVEKSEVKKDIKIEAKTEVKPDIKPEVKHEKQVFEKTEKTENNYEKKEFIPKIILAKKEVLNEKEKEVKEFIDGLLEKMSIDGKAEILEGGEKLINVNIIGQNLGNVIGRRGDTLDAIQYISNLVAKNGLELELKVRVDCENYREKRDLTLENLAIRMGKKVLKTKKNMTLEPMNPYERRKIHEVLQDFRGVHTYSTGKEPNRRVVVGLGEGKK